jgi:nucleoside transporter
MATDSPRLRLSVMMFGQYLILGTWAVTLATFLMAPAGSGGMNFTPGETAWVYSTFALAGIVAPVFVGLLADRLFAAEKLMGTLHLLGTLLLTAAGGWCAHRQPQIAGAAPEELAGAVRETFAPLFLLMFGYCFCYVTTLTLGNVVAFRNLHDPQHNFSKVRLYGTVGWIVAGVQLELFWNTISPAPLFLAAGLSAVVGLYCFTLPYTPPSGQAKSLGQAFGLPALTMFRELILCAAALAAVQQFYGVYANRFLTELGTPRPAAVQTLAQVAEVVCMALIPVALRRLGLKVTMALGLAGWAVRNGIFATGATPLIVAVGLPLHGLSYAFFFTMASMYVDRKAPTDLRASAQGIYTFVSLGVGTLLGNWFSARVVQAQTEGGAVAWPVVWLVPTCISAAILLVYLALFRDGAAGAVRTAAIPDDKAIPPGGPLPCDPTPSNAS